MSEPIVPPNHGITEEAAQALGLETTSDPQDISSDDDEASDGGPFFRTFTAGPLPDGDAIDGQQTAELPIERRGRSKRESQDGPREAKSTPPSLDEWSKFFSNVVLRVGTDFYIDLAFRGIDEDTLSERDLDRLAMTDEERNAVAVPFAELSYKSKFMRKHGRMIVASGDAIYALVRIGVWMSRVNRIAAKYRPKIAKGKVEANGSSRQGAEAPIWEGSSGGRFPPGFDGGWSNPGTG